MNRHHPQPFDLLPLIGVLILFFVPKNNHGQLRGVALGMTILTFLVSLPLITGKL